MTAAESEPDWGSIADRYESGDEKPWADVTLGDRVELYLADGPVIEVNVDPLFCAHRFENGKVRAQPRDMLVRVKHDLSPEQREQWIVQQHELWAQIRATGGEATDGDTD